VNNISYYFLIISITTVYFNQRNEMKNIEKNIGMIDRVIRIILGFILRYLFAVYMAATP